MRSRMHRKTDETAYVESKVSGWILRCLDLNIEMDRNFFGFIDSWVMGLRELTNELYKEITKNKKWAGKKLAKDIAELKNSKEFYLDSLPDLIEKHECVENIISDCLKKVCKDKSKLPYGHTGIFSNALDLLGKIFGIDRDCQRLAEFIFISQFFRTINSYLVDDLNLYRYIHKKDLAYVLEMTPEQLGICRKKLMKCGLADCEYNHGDWELEDCLLPLWDTGNIDTEQMFARPVAGRTLPLESFQLDQSEVNHVKKLLGKGGDSPVHILLYGPPGTGKTSFALSLAKACKMRGWAVNSLEDDNDSDRRASLTACLHMAAQHKNSFVLVDEAERLLYTGMGRQTKDKAWLNEFLERPGQRIIWISNQIEHIDPAVRRRFAYSLHFDNLGLKERRIIWRQVLNEQGVSKFVDEKRLMELAKNYQAEAAVINSAVIQAKDLYEEKSEFNAALERILQAQITLQRNGFKQSAKPEADKNFTLDGICIEGSPTAFLKKCRRIDTAMRENISLRPSCGTMLFYGPPGTGKTALARYIAGELDREYVVKRASDLLSPFVGVAEKQIDEAFAEAESSGGFLIIDEADTFIYSRDIAQRSWETSLVNQFLTNLEECRCFCVCTTNRKENLDAAVIRRFSHKIAFTYAGREQVKSLYHSLLEPLCKDSLSVELENKLLTLDRLTPGDFHAVRAQYDPLFTDPSEVDHEQLVEALAREHSLKQDKLNTTIGFAA